LTQVQQWPEQQRTSLPSAVAAKVSGDVDVNIAKIFVDGLRNG